MRLLVVHAWLRGNLGDVLQLSVLLSGLRELAPRALDLAGFPSPPDDGARDAVALADRLLPEPFPWYRALAPAALDRALLDPLWRKRRARLFAGYDAIVCAPGPYLADYDARAPGALSDICLARDLGLPLVLSSHSIGPLDPDALTAVGRATTCVAREPATFEYLRARGIPSVRSADLAFLYPYEAKLGAPDDAAGGRGPGVARVGPVAPVAPPAPPYRLVFLRSNNLDAGALRLDAGGLFEGSRPIAPASGEPIVLATSDCRRDRRFLSRVARRLGLPWVGCRTVTELVALVAGSSGVVSDRYHPAICAASLGRPARILANREPHKMQGLDDLLDRPLEELRALARAGLAAVRDALRAAV
jgi:polysaccharide pyruvyl transferase WcaK-like protein